jgi:hypothetical protein
VVRAVYLRDGSPLDCLDAVLCGVGETWGKPILQPAVTIPLVSADPYADKVTISVPFSAAVWRQAYWSRLDLDGGGVPDRPNVGIESGSEVFWA